MSLINVQESSEFIGMLDNLFENLNKFKDFSKKLGIQAVNLTRLENLLVKLKTDGEYNNVLFNDYAMTFNILALAFPDVKKIFKEYNINNLKLSEKDNKEYLKSLILMDNSSQEHFTHDFYKKMIPSLKCLIEKKKINDSKALVLALLTFNEEAMKEKKVDFLHNSFLYVKNNALLNLTKTWFFNLFNIKFVDYNKQETIKVPPLPNNGFVFGFEIVQHHQSVSVKTSAQLINLSSVQEIDTVQLMEATINEDLKKILGIYRSKFNLVKNINGKYVLVHRNSLNFEKEIKTSCDTYKNGYKDTFRNMMYKNLLKQENIVQAGSIVKFKEYLFFVVNMSSPLINELNENQIILTVAMLKNDCDCFDKTMDGNNLVEKVFSLNSEDFNKIKSATDFEKSLFLQFSGVC